MLIPTVGQTDTGDCPYRDTTEPEISGTVFRQRNRTALQYFQILRSGYRSFYYAGSDRAKGGLNLYAYVPNPLKYIDPLRLCKTDIKNDGPLLPASAWYKNAPN